ncbi:recombinase family protein [Shewanella abyssi]|uniref:recombinase family protein n=1 Tax=Shewanella abyssi TaxID=311789 RepID=UPI00200E2947|nr:recombinase family protein [Shewanella abyssi]MCL1051947.1 recombinase family protein [Shewanella abyssi]
MQSTEKKPIVISYLRWSTGTQALGDSERRQLSVASSWLEKNGYEINEDYILRDSAKSAFYSENFSDDGALGILIQKVKDGKIPRGTVLIIEDFSRFSRAKVRLAQQRFLELINNGIRVYIAKDGKEYNEDSCDMTDLIISISKMSSAHEESARKSYHLNEFWKNAREEASKNNDGQYPVLLPSMAPWWLSKVTGADGKKYFKPIEERKEVIERIFELAISGLGNGSGGLGSTQIARVLENEGVKPFTGERKNAASTFNDSYVLRLLNDRRLIGEHQLFTNPVNETTGKRERILSGNPIEDYFPPVIEETIFNAAREEIALRAVYQKGKVAKKCTNLFTKIVKCSYCGASMTLFSKKGSKAEGGKCVYLQCSEGTKFKKCGNRAVRYFDTFEKTILKTLTELELSLLFDNSKYNEEDEKNSIRNQQNKISEELVIIETKVSNATHLLLVDTNDLDTKKARTELTSRRAKLRLELTHLEEKLFTVSRSVNYASFQDNLSLVMDTFNSEDELATYIQRRTINTHLIDIIQYIAIDGVNQSAWVVFDLNYFKQQLADSFSFTDNYLNQCYREGTLSVFSTEVTESEVEALEAYSSGICAHLKIKLKRFNTDAPTYQDVLNLRRAYEVAPKELRDINEIVNSAINQNWKTLRRRSYEIIDNDLYDQIQYDASGAAYLPQE